MIILYYWWLSSPINFISSFQLSSLHHCLLLPPLYASPLLFLPLLLSPHLPLHIPLVSPGIAPWLSSPDSEGPVLSLPLATIVTTPLWFNSGTGGRCEHLYRRHCEGRDSPERGLASTQMKQKPLYSWEWISEFNWLILGGPPFHAMFPELSSCPLVVWLSLRFTGILGKSNSHSDLRDRTAEGKWTKSHSLNKLWTLLNHQTLGM